MKINQAGLDLIKKFEGSLSKRFHEKVEFIPFHSCWEWVGSKTSRGYGRINRGARRGKIEKAHRVAYELYIAPPGELCVLHRCDNPGCVNPYHLFLGTQGDNVLDMMKKKRGKGQFNKGLDSRSSRGHNMSIKTHCPLGHPYVGDNLVRYSSGGTCRRYCRTCLRANERRRYHENKRQRA